MLPSPSVRLAIALALLPLPCHRTAAAPPPAARVAEAAPDAAPPQAEPDGEPAAGPAEESPAEKAAAALQNGDWAAVRAWLQAGGDPKAELGDEGQSALHLLAAHPHPDLQLARELLRAGADARAKSRNDGTPLHWAAAKGNVELMQLLSDAGADPKARDASRTTPLHEAARAGRAEAVRFLLGRGAPVNAADAEGMTALSLAVQGSDVETVRALLAGKADVAHRTDEGWDPLALAVAFGKRDDVLEALVAAGVRVNPRRGTPYLHLAVRACNARAAQFLLAHGADPKARDVDGTPLWKAVMARNASEMECRDEATVRLLLDRGMPPDGPKDPRGDTYLLHVLSEYRLTEGTLPVVKLLLERGASANARARDGSTPLLLAAGKGSMELVELLLAHGADPGLASKKGERPLARALAEHDAAMVKALLTHAARAGMDAGDRDLVLSALPPRARALDEKLLRVLLEAGARADARTPAGDTPLLAYLRCPDAYDPSLLALLVKRSADPRAKSRAGDGPLHLAADLANGVFLEALLAGGLPPDERDAEGRTALMRLVAAVGADAETVDRLIAAGADPNARDARLATPLLLARRGEPEVVAALLRHGADPLAMDAAGRDAVDVLCHSPGGTCAAIAERLGPALLLRPAADPVSPAQGRRVVVTWPNGNRYEGPVREGLLDGTGVCTVAGKRGPCTYEAGARILDGGHHYDEGDAWSGTVAIEVQRDAVIRKPHGNGTMRFGGGDVYEGPWTDTWPTEGTYRWAHLDGSYRGPHTRGLPDGKGTCTLRGVTAPCEARQGWPLHPGDQVLEWQTSDGWGTYYGPVKDGKPHGFGLWRHDSSGPRGRDEYWGEWQLGRRRGKGDFVSPAGKGFRGTWANDLRQGPGICRQPWKGREVPCAFDRDEEVEPSSPR